MKNLFFRWLGVFGLMASFGLISNSAFAVYQFVDCALSDSPERVILNIYSDQSSGTFFATTGISDGEQHRTPALAMKKVSETDSVVVFEAPAEGGIYVVEFPKEMIHQSSTGFAVMIGSRGFNDPQAQVYPFACFSSLYDY